jgi:hypothetical protein
MKRFSTSRSRPSEASRGALPVRGLQTGARMLASALRRPLAFGAFAAIAAWSSVVFADGFDMADAINRPLTLPGRTLGVGLGGGARHFENGVILSTVGLGAGYGITSKFEVNAEVFAVEMTPDARPLPPSGGVTYAFFDQVVEAGLSFHVGGVLTPSPGIVLTPSLPMRVPISSRFRLDFEPSLPILTTSHPAIGVVVPMAATFGVTSFFFVRFDTGAEVLDVRARSMFVPLRLTLEVAAHVKHQSFSLDPFFAFPEFWTPGDERPHLHPNDYGGGLNITTWFQL